MPLATSTNESVVWGNGQIPIFCSGSCSGSGGDNSTKPPARVQIIRCSIFPSSCSRSCRQRRVWNSTSGINSIIKDINAAHGRASHHPHPSMASSTQEEEEDEFQVLTAMRSEYNEIVILDTPNSRLLLLDSTHNVHSMLNKGSEEKDKWTGSYWDEFASLPPIIPSGPIAIFGLAGGTAAHLMLQLWPWLRIQGWEIDEILIDKAREYLGLSLLEEQTEAGGKLDVNIGDVLSLPLESGCFAGIVVDLFSEGRVLPQLQEAATWLGWKDRLLPGGRIMVNCGGVGKEGSTSWSANDYNSKEIRRSLGWEVNATIVAMSKAFPGELSWRKTAEGEGENYLALTGPLPDLRLWSTKVPGRLSNNVREWRPCIVPSND